MICIYIDIINNSMYTYTPSFHCCGSDVLSRTLHPCSPLATSISSPSPSDGLWARILANSELLLGKERLSPKEASVSLHWLQ